MDSRGGQSCSDPVRRDGWTSVGVGSRAGLGSRSLGMSLREGSNWCGPSRRHRSDASWLVAGISTGCRLSRRAGRGGRRTACRQGVIRLGSTRHVAVGIAVLGWYVAMGGDALDSHDGWIRRGAACRDEGIGRRALVRLVAVACGRLRLACHAEQGGTGPASRVAPGLRGAEQVRRDWGYRVIEGPRWTVAVASLEANGLVPTCRVGWTWNGVAVASFGLSRGHGLSRLVTPGRRVVDVGRLVALERRGLEGHAGRERSVPTRHDWSRWTGSLRPGWSHRSDSTRMRLSRRWGFVIGWQVAQGSSRFDSSRCLDPGEVPVGSSRWWGVRGGGMGRRSGRAYGWLVAQTWRRTGQSHGGSPGAVRRAEQTWIAGRRVGSSR